MAMTPASDSLTEDPRDRRSRTQAEVATSAAVEASRDVLRARAKELYLSLDWDPAYERDALEEFCQKAVVVLDQAELEQAFAEGRKQVIGYSEAGAEFHLAPVRSGKRHFDFLGDCHVTVELKDSYQRDSDEIYCRLVGEARGVLLSGQAYAEQDAYLEVSRSGKASFHGRATGLLDSMGAWGHCYEDSRVEVRRASQVRAAGRAQLLVDRATSRGQMVLCDEATIADLSGEILVTVPDLLEAENDQGNERWLRGDELRCFHWKWLQRR